MSTVQTILLVGLGWILVAGVVGYFAGGWLKRIAEHYAPADEDET